MLTILETASLRARNRAKHVEDAEVVKNRRGVFHVVAPRPLSIAEFLRVSNGSGIIWRKTQAR